jgi:hypothetical protein
VLELIVFSDRIGDKSGVSGSGGVGISSKVSNMFDACVVLFESTIELCIRKDVGEAIYEEK